MARRGTKIETTYGQDGKQYTKFTSRNDGTSVSYDETGREVGRSELRGDGKGWQHFDANGQPTGYTKRNADGSYSTVDFNQIERVGGIALDLIKTQRTKSRNLTAQGVNYRGVGVVAFVLALSNLVLGWTVLVPVLSIVFGIVSLVGFNPALHRGRALGIVAIILSSLALVADLIFLIIFVAGLINR